MRELRQHEQSHSFSGTKHKGQNTFQFFSQMLVIQVMNSSDIATINCLVSALPFAQLAEEKNDGTRKIKRKI